MVSSESERVVTTRVVRIVLDHLPTDPFSEDPVARVPCCLSDDFHGEERLHPVVRTWQRPNLLHEIFQHRVRTIALTSTQEVLPLQFLQSRRDERLSA